LGKAKPEAQLAQSLADFDTAVGCVHVFNI
jgi:hypothetical protein